ncbi:MAG: hypothetical protein A2X56_12425 [Nitrospirae bacterium GWC2_57_13]|jgi:hypothetical protein|nr:MAG: hypothetical protein A2072_01560 [Nitrospirae bacterium GWC1_57_7]OGW26432.1 MAG: hypothetical protein A2X56_12425 [Nitrospirae bacterium GWC2_57_13]OGW46116.1 MAG: hypothetical protein A2X57_03840 [Nitrospirae bacterium GWD2_57_8]HAS55235.1 hypothetical protein [Nitrospiraceae bacterium]
MRSRITAVLAVVVLAVSLFTTPAMAADPALKPFVLGSSGPGTIDAKLAEVKAALALEGFEVVGEYTPYKGAHVVVVTSEALRNNAAKSGFGAYGAAQRISLTETAKGLQIAYTNPLYMAQAYRMKDGLADVAAAMEKALGKKNEFGSEIGITAGKLRKYHYMMMMPYFDDQVKLGTHTSHDEALQAVEANLAARKGGCAKVYRVDVPGKKESLFGVAITEGDGADATVMKIIDTAELKATAHLPYELIVSDGKAYMLHGKFRIAVNFPDLAMGTFMKISGAPGDIEDKLKLVAGGK